MNNCEIAACFGRTTAELESLGVAERLEQARARGTAMRETVLFERARAAKGQRALFYFLKRASRQEDEERLNKWIELEAELRSQPPSLKPL